MPGAESARALAAFAEKPDAETAQAAISSEGGYLWNSGMFMVRARSGWRPSSSAGPISLRRVAQRSGAKLDRRGLRPAGEERPFLACASESIDYAVMEQLGSERPGCRRRPATATAGVVVPLDAGLVRSGGLGRGLGRVGERRSREMSPAVTSSLTGHGTRWCRRIPAWSPPWGWRTWPSLKLPTRCSWRRGTGPATSRSWWTSARARRADHSRASPSLSALGMVRVDRPGAALSSQAPDGGAGSQHEPAVPPAPGRALGGGARSWPGLPAMGATSSSRRTLPRTSLRAPPTGSPNPGDRAARDHRGAIGGLPRRGRHRPSGGQLRPRVESPAGLEERRAPSRRLVRGLIVGRFAGSTTGWGSCPPRPERG